MCRRLDISGKRFHCLTAIKPIRTERYGVVWECVCDCGNMVEVNTTNLRRGNNKSCGCIKGKEQIIDIKGQKYGYLLVLDSLICLPKLGMIWVCLCDCGAICCASSGKLRYGHIRSCGCLQTELASECNTTHGLSYTLEYKKVCSLVHREYSKAFDSVWTVEMEQLLCDLQPRCVICNAPAKATDHVLPLSKGYGLKPGNAVRLCKSCNSKKSNKDINKLDDETRTKILQAAESFRVLWTEHVP